MSELSEPKISEQIYQLVQITTQLSTQMTEMQKSLGKLESITPSVVLHEEQINQLKISLGRGNDKFEKIEKRIDKSVEKMEAIEESLDARLDNLERAEGNKAKKAFATVGSYLLVTIAAAVVSNIGNIINALSGK